MPVTMSGTYEMTSHEGRCGLLRQASFAPCVHGRSFGCDAASGSMWTAKCRGTFRCAGRTVLCGFPPGDPTYNCSCRDRGVQPATRHSRNRSRAALHSAHDARVTSHEGRCELARQDSVAPCVHGRSFGCTARSMWTAACRGTFRCGPSTVECGFPPGGASYNCSCTPTSSNRLIAKVASRCASRGSAAPDDSLVSLGGRWLIFSTLLVCPIEKNMATSWLKLLHAQHGWLKASESRGQGVWAIAAFSYQSRLLPMWSALADDQRRALIGCPFVEWIVTIRDPRERLLSAYIDKCLHYKNEVETGRHCVAHPLHHPKRKPLKVPHLEPGQPWGTAPQQRYGNISFAHFVRALTRRHVARPSCDYHFCEQSSFCGLSDAAFRSTVRIIRLEPGCMPGFDARLRDDLLRHGFDPAHVAAFSEGDAQHRTDAAGWLDSYYTAELSARVYKLYRNDYVTFGLPAPRGVRSAP